MSSRHAQTFVIALLAALFGLAAPSSAETRGGGLLVPGVPQIDDVTCLSGCNAIRESSPGGTVQISGSGLSRVEAVSFAARKGRILVSPGESSATRLEARVPKGAVTGHLRVRSSSGSTSSPSEATLAIGPVPSPAPSPLRLVDASVSPRVAYQYGARSPRIDFVISGGRPENDLRIDIVSADGDLVASRVRKGVTRGSSERVTWSGKVRGRAASSGRYRFVVRSLDGTPAVVPRKLTSSGRSGSAFGFAIYGYIFPVRGPHSYGDGIGAGRGHQGQDVMARCGTPLLAARGGTVYYNAYQAGGAGNYIVINTAGTKNRSQVYMHLSKPSPLKVGTRVKTGQRIGTVGTTGRSTACHLHFEEWSSPGWYQGGTFLSPTDSLKRWDRYS
jgi:murein DD-endopeptidase MepM/ murein hydrolase activator NlpD